MNINDLKKILESHKDWQRGNGGTRANLQDANLEDAHLQGAHLQGAHLQGANLEGAHLQGAHLEDANLEDAYLQDANLEDAYLQDAHLEDAHLQGANLQDAHLQGAHLQGAHLQGAHLQGANLEGANLEGANLEGANLQDANLWCATNLKRVHQSNLAILKFQKGGLRAFKYLDGMRSPYKNGIYEVGKTYEIDNFDMDERVLCGEGLNVATLDWCLLDTNCDLTKTYIEVEFDVDDIVAIPYNTDGKFRVRKLKVIRKLSKKELENYLELLYPKTGEK